MFHDTIYILPTDSGNRHLFIRPVWLQTHLNEPPMPTGKYLIYESLVPYDDMSDSDIDAYLEKAVMPAYDNREDEIYLGCYSCNPDTLVWQWEGKSPGFSQEEFNKLAEFIQEYQEPEIEDFDSESAEAVSFRDTPLPEERDKFNITINVEGENIECAVLNWGNLFEVQFRYSYILLSVDENNNWVQTHGEKLLKEVKSRIIKLIEEHYL